MGDAEDLLVLGHVGHLHKEQLFQLGQESIYD